MSRITLPKLTANGRSLCLSSVDWQTYSRLVHAFAERRDVRLTYDQGELEIMSPRLEHDDDGWFLGDLVFVLTEELRLPLKRGGATTLRARLKARGIEPDACFWIQNAHKMAGRRHLDLRRDPPPDLAIEIAVTSSSLDRLGNYAALRVPEVWRLEGRELTYHILGADGNYTTATHSLAFPLIRPADLLRFLNKARKAGDENVVFREFRSWLRNRVGS